MKKKCMTNLKFSNILLKLLAGKKINFYQKDLRMKNWKLVEALQAAQSSSTIKSSNHSNFVVSSSSPTNWGEFFYEFYFLTCCFFHNLFNTLFIQIETIRYF